MLIPKQLVTTSQAIGAMTTLWLCGGLVVKVSESQRA